MFSPAVQHERAPRTPHPPLSHPYPGALLGPRGLRGAPGAAGLFTGLPLHDPGAATLQHPHAPYLPATGLLYPGMLAGFVKPTFLTTSLSEYYQR